MALHCVVEQHLLHVPDNATVPTVSCFRRNLLVGGRGPRCSGENHLEHSFGPGSLSVFYAHRVACSVEAVKEKCETRNGRFTMFVCVCSALLSLSFFHCLMKPISVKPVVH